MVKKIFLVLLLLSLTNCASNKTKSHMSSVIGATAGYGTCRALLDSGLAVTAACTVIGALTGASLFYNDDMNIHKAVFVDTLNTSPGKISHTNWGNSATGSWGSIKINRTYLVGIKKCKDYESTISINQSWPFNGVKRETEHGSACQMPDGRWYIQP